MVDDSKYVIVPNKTEIGSGLGKDEPIYSSNDNGRYVAALIAQGYRVIKSASNKDSVHYVLIKFKPGTRPTRAGETPGTTPLEDEITTPTPADEPIPF